MQFASAASYTASIRSPDPGTPRPVRGRLETEFEVDQTRNGVTWTVTIRRNGVRVVSTKATTKAPSGSFSVERRLTNGSGAGRITARATSPSGQVCTAGVTV